MLKIDQKITRRATHNLPDELRTEPLVIQRGEAGVLNLQTHQNSLGVLDHILALGLVRVVEFVFQSTQPHGLILCVLLHMLGLVTSLLYLSMNG